ncbi:unnamed protein product [Urochloa humidicola]
MPRRGRTRKPKPSYRRRCGNEFLLLPEPAGVPVPMCFCGDRCKVAESEEEEMYRQRYWMCANYAFDPTPQQIHIGLLTPPPLCNFEQWIDTKIKPKDKEWLEQLKHWAEEDKELLERKRAAEVAEKGREEERWMRLAAKSREEREKKLERVRRAKAALEENPDALNKGKWPRCTQ